MKGIHKKKWFWPAIIVLAIIVLVVIVNSKTVDGSKGGILEGPSHKEGGIDGVIKGRRGKIELEGNEDILTANVNRIKDEYFCQGTPGGIASALNVIGGGVEFNRNGQCTIKN